MARLYGDSLALVGEASGADNIIDMETATIGGRTFLYGANSETDAIDIFEVLANGAVSQVSSFQPGAALLSVRDIEVFSVAGSSSPFLAAAFRSGTERGVTLYELSDDGAYLTEVSQELLPSGATRLESIETGGQTVLLLGGVSAPETTRYKVDATGTLTFVDAWERPQFDNTFFTGPSISAPIYSDTASANGIDAYYVNTYGVSGTYTTSLKGVRSTGFEVSEAVLPLSTRFNENRDLIGKSAGIVIDDNALVYVPNTSSGQISVLKVPLSSSVTATEIAVLKTPDLTAVSEVRIVEVGDTPYLAALTNSETDLLWFSIDTDPYSFTMGQLTPVAIFDVPDNSPADLEKFGASVNVDGTGFLVTFRPESDQFKTYEIGALDDTLTGTQSGDQIFGGKGDDIITALGGGDDVNGGPGSDVIYLGGGNDVARASLGQDAVYAGSGYDTLDMRRIDLGSDGVTVDFLRSRVELPDGDTQFITGFERAIGTVNDDLMVGDNLDNDLSGNAGNDLMRGREGDDLMNGGSGDDRMFGASGSDTMNAAAGNDRMNGGSGDDIMEGSDGDDLLFGGTGDDIMTGGQQNDVLKGNAGNDTVSGGAGDDIVIGQTGDDMLFGGANNDLLQGGSGRDTLMGGAGDDTLTGGSAADIFVFDVATGGGYDTITDFKDGIDRLDVTDYGLSAAQVIALAAENEHGLEIKFVDLQVIMLENVTLATLDVSDFVL